MNVQSQIKSALNHYLESGNVSGLQLLIAKHPEVISAETSGEYPDVHRLVDIQIGSQAIRVCRQISQGEVLMLVLVGQVFDTPGVPLWLEGEKLRAWAQSEEENQSDEPADWNQYR